MCFVKSAIQIKITWLRLITVVPSFPLAVCHIDLLNELCGNGKWFTGKVGGPLAVFCLGPQGGQVWLWVSHIRWFLPFIKDSWDGMEVRFYCLLSVIPFSFSVQTVYLSSLGMSMSQLGDEAFEKRNTQCGNDPFTQVNRCFYCSRPPNGFTSAHT